MYRFLQQKRTFDLFKLWIIVLFYAAYGTVKDKIGRQTNLHEHKFFIETLRFPVQKAATTRFRLLCNKFNTDFVAAKCDSFHIWITILFLVQSFDKFFYLFWCFRYGYSSDEKSHSLETFEYARCDNDCGDNGYGWQFI